MKNIEQELKIQLTQRQYQMLVSQSGVSPVKQVNYYFDGDGKPQNLTVRIREKNGEYVLCAKVRKGNSNGVSVSDEYEKVVGAEFLRVAQNVGLSRDCLKNALGVDADCTLFCQGSLTTYRSKFMLDGFVVEVDKNEYLGVCDYELECENSDVARLEELKTLLNYRFGIPCKPSKGKAARFAEQKATQNLQ